MKIVITPNVYQKIAEFKNNWKYDDVPDAKEVLIRVDIGNGTAKELELTLAEFLDALGLGEAEKQLHRPCETCNDTRKVPAMGRVYAGEPHQADVDETKCPDCLDSNDQG